MKRRKSGGGYRREKAVMIASTALVLSAMTVTGVYVYNNKPEEPEENVVDFSALEQETQEAAEVENRSAKNLTSGEGDSGELDYDPYYARQDALLNGQTANAGAKKTEEGGTAAETESADAPHNVGYAEFGTGADGAEMALDLRTETAQRWWMALDLRTAAGLRTALRLRTAAGLRMAQSLRTERTGRTAAPWKRWRM